MSLPLAILIVVLVATFTNRILAVLAGLWFRVPDVFLLSLLIAMDLIQIPAFYWLYGHSSVLLPHLPAACRRWFEKDWSTHRFGKWVSSLGGFGVMLVSFLPTFGGGMWSAVFLAYSLRLPRRSSTVWIALGSISSYMVIYWVLDTLVATVRYFAH